MTELIKKLRAETGAGVMDIKRALDEARGDEQRAIEILQARGVEVAGKKAGRATRAGRIESYLHGNPPTIGVLVEVLCETDFVAKTEEFRQLARELAMQVASMRPATVEELLSQEYIRDPHKTVQDLVNENIHKLGENIQVRRFVRYIVGE
jgi:elongation factor Ts